MLTRKLFGLCLTMLCILHPAISIAQDEANVVLPEIDVRGLVRRDELKSTSATVLENNDVTNRRYTQPLDMMLLSPGTSISFSTNNGVAPTARIRTFSGSHGGELAMYLDGIPLQDSGHTDNYIDSNLIIPLEIETLEIIKGPASVYYGTGAAGGTLAYQTFKRGDFTHLNFRYGSFNEADASGIIARTLDKLSQVYVFEAFHTDGWRQKSDWNRGNVSARWTYDFTDQFSASLNVRAYTSEWNNAGNLFSKFTTDPEQFVDDGSGESNGGTRRRFDARFWANYKITAESQFTYYAYMTDLTNTRWEFSFPTLNGRYQIDYIGDRKFDGQSTDRSDDTEQASSRKAYGTGLSYNFKGDLGGHEANMTVGFDYLFENEVRDKYRHVWGQGRRRGPQITNTDYDLKTTSFFGEAGYQLIDSLLLRAGLRFDNYNGKLQTGPNQAIDGVLRPNSSYAVTRKAFSPKFGALFTPLDWLDIYANYGHGVGLPGMTSGQFYANFAELMKRDQIELGYKLRPTDWIDFEMVYYHILTKNDSTSQETFPGSGSYETVYAGKTKRYGLESVIEFRPIEYLSLSGNFTYQIAKYKDNISSGSLMNGLEMTGIPKYITNIEANYEPESGFGGRLRYRLETDSLSRNNPAFRQNGTPNASPLVYKNPDQSTLDAQVNYKFNDTYKVSLDVLNVLNKHKNFSQGIPDSNGFYTFAEQTPLTVYLSLDVNWD